MSDSEFDQFEFSAEMNTEQFEDGELFHLESERDRRLVFSIGLTKDSAELMDVLQKDFDTYLDAITIGKNTIQHYQDLMDLLVTSVNRLEYILEKHVSENFDELTDEQKNTIAEISKKEQSESEH